MKYGREWTHSPQALKQIKASGESGTLSKGGDYEYQLLFKASQPWLETCLNISESVSSLSSKRLQVSVRQGLGPSWPASCSADVLAAHACFLPSYSPSFSRNLTVPYAAWDLLQVIVSPTRWLFTRSCYETTTVYITVSATNFQISFYGCDRNTWDNNRKWKNGFVLGFCLFVVCFWLTISVVDRILCCGFMMRQTMATSTWGVNGRSLSLRPCLGISHSLCVCPPSPLPPFSSCPSHVLAAIRSLHQSLNLLMRSSQSLYKSSPVRNQSFNPWTLRNKLVMTCCVV